MTDSDLAIRGAGFHSLPQVMEADRAKVVDRPTKHAGQAEACLTRPAINVRENSRHLKKRLLSTMALPRFRVNRATTLGHGIDRDRADCSAGAGKGCNRPKADFGEEK